MRLAECVLIPPTLEDSAARELYDGVDAEDAVRKIKEACPEDPEFDAVLKLMEGGGKEEGKGEEAT